MNSKVKINLPGSWTVHECKSTISNFDELFIFFKSGREFLWKFPPPNIVFQVQAQVCFYWISFLIELKKLRERSSRNELQINNNNRYEDSVILLNVTICCRVQKWLRIQIVGQTRIFQTEFTKLCKKSKLSALKVPTLSTPESQLCASNFWEGLGEIWIQWGRVNRNRWTSLKQLPMAWIE